MEWILLNKKKEEISKKLPIPSKKKKHLVISSGGIYGISAVGVLETLDKKGQLDHIETYIGSSVGGILSLVLNLGYTVAELREIILNVDFGKFKNLSISHLFEKFGMDSGDKFAQLIRAIIKQKISGIPPEKVTFKQLFDKTGKKLAITGSCVNQGIVHYFDYVRTPDMPVALAIKITMAIPIIYYPVKYKGNLYTDGGAFAPYPTEYLLPEEQKEAIGICMDQEISPTNIPIKLDEYLFRVLHCYKEHMFRMCYKNTAVETVVIKIPSNIEVMEFNLNKKEKIKLLEIGAESATAFLNRE